jgi:hypothetical protein
MQQAGMDACGRFGGVAEVVRWTISYGSSTARTPPAAWAIPAHRLRGGVNANGGLYYVSIFDPPADRQLCSDKEKEGAAFHGFQRILFGATGAPFSAH